MQLDLYAKVVGRVIEQIEPLHVLDYGCGDEIPLAHALKNSGLTVSFKYQAYDPQVKRFATPPLPADIVVCLSGLNDIEDEDAESKLDDLLRLTEAVAVIGIHDERPPWWWLPRIMCRFDVQTYQRMPDGGFYVIAYAQHGQIEGTDGNRLS